MNYYLDALLELQIAKLNELKSKGATTISIDVVLKMLTNMQNINKGEVPSTDLNLQNDKK